MRGAFESLAQYEVHWEERCVVPLAPDAASMTDIIGFTATPKSGEVTTGRVACLNVFVKRGEAWKLLHAQNMTLAPPETE